MNLHDESQDHEILKSPAGRHANSIMRTQKTVVTLARNSQPHLSAAESIHARYLVHPMYL